MDQDWKDGKANDALYRSNVAASQTAGASSAQGTGQFVDLKPAPAPQTESLGEAAARAKATKTAPVKGKDAPKKAVKVMGEFSKGGKVKKTAIYKLHKNERVLNPKQTKKAEKMSALKSVLSGK